MKTIYYGFKKDIAGFLSADFRHFTHTIGKIGLIEDLEVAKKISLKNPNWQMLKITIQVEEI